MQEYQSLTGFIEFKGALFNQNKKEEDERTGIEKPDSDYESWTRLQFRLCDVSGWHETLDKRVCVALLTGGEWVLKIKYEDFSDMMNEYDQLLFNPQLN